MAGFQIAVLGIEQKLVTTAFDSISRANFHCFMSFVEPEPLVTVPGPDFAGNRPTVDQN